MAIMGSSGAGKSTLLNILGCLDRPSAGSYILDGRDVARLSEAELTEVRRHKIGFVFQSFHLVPRLTAAANVELPMLFAGLPQGRTARARWRGRSRRSGWRRAPTTGRTSCPAASASGWRSPGRSVLGPKILLGRRADRQPRQPLGRGGARAARADARRRPHPGGGHPRSQRGPPRRPGGDLARRQDPAAGAGPRDRQGGRLHHRGGSRPRSPAPGNGAAMSLGGDDPLRRPGARSATGCAPACRWSA